MAPMREPSRNKLPPKYLTKPAVRSKRAPLIMLDSCRLGGQGARLRLCRSTLYHTLRLLQEIESWQYYLTVDQNQVRLGLVLDLHLEAY